MKRYTNHEVSKLLQHYDCELLSEYKNTTSDIKIRCKCGNIFYKKLKIMNKSKLYMCNDCVKNIQTKNQTMPYSEVKKKIEEIGYKMITTESEYIRASVKCKIKCINGHVREQIPLDLFAGHKCKICATEEVVSKQRLNDKNIKNIIKSKELTLISLNGYKNVSDKVIVKCNKCGHIFEPSIHNLRSGTGCPKCYESVRGKSNIISYEDRCKYVESFGYKIITPKVEYINGDHKVDVMCNQGHVYSVKLHDFYIGNRCPICRKSKGEIKISNILKKLSIEFIEQYRFDDCKFKRTLPFDFYLPDYNCCIEYDGKQHYIIDGFGGNLWDFVDIKIRDTVKDIYCQNNNIKLIRIPYWEFDNIEEILNGKIDKIS